MSIANNNDEIAGQTAIGCLRTRIEEQPWQGLSYAISTAQFMLISLDLFMDTSHSKAWHYTITSVEFVGALCLAFYQNARLLSLLQWCHHNDKPMANQASIMLACSLILQCGIFGCSAVSFVYNADSLEWAMFALSIAWGILFPLSFGAVQEVKRKQTEQKNKSSKPKLGPLSAVYSIFRHHLFGKAPLLSASSLILATAHALLTTYQGAMIIELTKAVTKTNEDGVLKASGDQVKNLCVSLLGVWAASVLSKFLLDVVTSQVFATLEIWLRHSIFQRAIHASNSNVASYQTNYASDITGVVSLYGSLLNGVVVNLLLIVTAFCFLAIEEWRIACVTLGFLAMGVTNGPTLLATKSAAQTQRYVTDGIALLAESCASRNNDIEKGDKDQMQLLEQQHHEHVLKPLQLSLFQRTFFTGSVETFIQFFSTFLTAVVVITMSWQVYNGEMDSSDFLGVFFVFKQLQKPATKLSGIIKKLVKQTASLERVNAVVLPTKPTIEESQAHERTLR